MIKILVYGVSGRLGQVLCDCVSRAEDMVVTAGVDKSPMDGAHLFSVYNDINKVIETVDIIIDFSRPESIETILPFAKQKNCGVVVATTGHTPGQKKLIAQYAASIPVFFAANMSLGVNLQIELVKKAAEFLGDSYDIEIIEKHHNIKVDSPSGTALTLAEELNHVFSGAKEYSYGRTPQSGRRDKKEIGIHAVRGGTIVGEHEVLFLGNDEVLSVHHQALSKQVFAVGALRAARYLAERSPGLYSMADMIAEANAVTRIYSDDNQAIVTLTSIPAVPSNIAEIFGKMAKLGVNIDIISQTMPVGGTVNVTFSLPRKDVPNAQTIISEIAGKHPDMRHQVKDPVTKLTIEGMGMERQSGVAAKLFLGLASNNIDILTITTSETKILLCIENQNTAATIRVISKTFKL